MSTPTMAPAKTPQETSIPLDAVRERLRRKGSLKGRQPDDASRAEVQAPADADHDLRGLRRVTAADGLHAPLEPGDLDVANRNR